MKFKDIFKIKTIDSIFIIFFTLLLSISINFIYAFLISMIINYVADLTAYIIVTGIFKIEKIFNKNK